MFPEKTITFLIPRIIHRWSLIKPQNEKKNAKKRIFRTHFSFKYFKQSTYSRRDNADSKKKIRFKIIESPLTPPGK